MEGAGKLLEDASQQLEEYIGTFGKYKPPTVIGAVDPLTGKIVTTSSGAVPDVIAPELEAYAESLGGWGLKPRVVILWGAVLSLGPPMNCF